MFYILPIYAPTGGSEPGNEAVAQVSDDLFTDACIELRAHPDGPALIPTDLNANTASLHTLQTCLDTHRWHDLGHQAATWGAQPDQTTCLGYNANTRTRRDYIFANHAAKEYVTGFNVECTDDFEVHDPVQITLRIPNATPTYNTHVTANDFSELFETRVQEAYDKRNDTDTTHSTVHKQHLQGLHTSLTTAINKATEEYTHTDHTLEQHWEWVSNTLKNGLTHYFQLTTTEAAQYHQKGSTKYGTTFPSKVQTSTPPTTTSATTTNHCTSNNFSM